MDHKIEKCLYKFQIHPYFNDGTWIFADITINRVQTGSTMKISPISMSTDMLYAINKAIHGSHYITVVAKINRIVPTLGKPDIEAELIEKYT